MKKRIEKLASRLNSRVMYFTENPIRPENTEGKYFLCWQNTHTIYKAFKTQQECVECLEEIIDRKIICVAGREFKVVD